MGKLIAKYSTLLKDEEQKNAKKLSVVEASDPLERYREVKANHQPFIVMFNTATPEGTLVGEDEFGVYIVLENELLAKDLSYYNASIKNKFINIEFNVVVDDIDEKKNTVYVRSARSNRGTTRSKLIGEIISDLENGKEVMLPGRVVHVNERRVLVDILGQGILGINQIKHWTNGYLRTPDMIKPGEIYDFIVTKKKPKGNHATQAFELRRDSIAEDPWKNIPEYIKEDGVLPVECIERPDNKTYWWGRNDLVKGIEIMCDYTAKIGHPLIGAIYDCKIKKLDPEAHIFKVVPFDLSKKNDARTQAAVKMMNKGKRRSK